MRWVSGLSIAQGLYPGRPFRSDDPCKPNGAGAEWRPVEPTNGAPMPSRPQAVPHVHISEPHVRVTEWRFAPGAGAGGAPHEADYVVVPMLDGDLLLEEPGGGSRTATLKQHVPYARREGVEHNVINANPFDFAFMEIEHLKG